MRRKRDGRCFCCRQVGSKLAGTTLRSANTKQRYNELVHLYSFRTTNRAGLVTIRICTYCLRKIMHEQDVYPSQTISRPARPLSGVLRTNPGVSGEGDST